MLGSAGDISFFFSAVVLKSAGQVDIPKLGIGLLHHPQLLLLSSIVSAGKAYSLNFVLHGIIVTFTRVHHLIRIPVLIPVTVE